MIYNERNIRKEIVLEAAKQIMMAARTAPKGKGVDIIEIITLSHDSLPTLSENMRSEGKKRGMMFFLLRGFLRPPKRTATILWPLKRRLQEISCP